MEFNCVFKDAMEVDGDKEFERAADRKLRINLLVTLITKMPSCG
jgi:hypothetical protein